MQIPLSVRHCKEAKVFLPFFDASNEELDFLSQRLSMAFYDEITSDGYKTLTLALEAILLVEKIFSEE